MVITPFISFFTGVISVLSPCILPILPILLGFTLKSKKPIDLILFVLGLFSIFTIVIFLTAFFTVVIYKYISYFRIIAAIFLIILGILFISNKNIFNFNIAINTKKTGHIGSFILGFLTSTAWAPCYGGYLISLLTLLSTSGNPTYTSFNIITYCFGFGFTLLILSFIIQKINIERFIKKSEYISKIFGILIVLSGFHMLILLLNII